MLNENGHEVLDDTPIALPLRLSRPPSRLEELRSLLNVVNREALTNGQETFQEADDFNVGDDYDPRSPWELSADQELYVESTLATGTPPPGVPGPTNGNASPLPVPPISQPAVPSTDQQKGLTPL